MSAQTSRTSGIALRLGTVGQVWRMTRRTSRWWLTPMLLLLSVLGLALAGLQAIPYVAPFIYAVF